MSETVDFNEIKKEVGTMLSMDSEGVDVIDCSFGFLKTAMEMVVDSNAVMNGDCDSLADSAMNELKNMKLNGQKTDSESYKRAIAYFIGHFSMSIKILSKLTTLIQNPAMLATEIDAMTQLTQKSYYFLGKALIEYGDISYKDSLPSYKALKYTVDSHGKGIEFL